LVVNYTLHSTYVPWQKNLILQFLDFNLELSLVDDEEEHRIFLLSIEIAAFLAFCQKASSLNFRPKTL